MYHSLTDLTELISLQELTQLVDDELCGEIVETPANAAMARVTAAGAKAQTFIDNYCRGRYTVPFLPTPDLIKEISIALAVYFLFERKRVASDDIVKRYTNSVGLLDHIRQGKIVLDVATPEAAPANFQTNKTVDDRVFTQETLDRI